MLRWLVILLSFAAGCVTGMLVSVSGLYRLGEAIRYGPPPPEPAVSPQGHSQTGVWALGRLEPAGGVIDVMGIPGDRLLSLDVEIGAQVVAGQRLGTWESEGAAEREIVLIDAQIAEARRRWENEQREAERRLELARLAEAHADSQAKRQLETEEKRLELLQLAVATAEQRYDQLVWLTGRAPDLVAPVEKQEAEFALRKAELELQIARSAFEALRQTVSQTAEKAAAERKAAEEILKHLQEANPLEALQIQRQIAVERKLASSLLAPQSGQVIRIGMQPGERVTQQPVVQLADLTRMVCVAEVPFHQVSSLREGQQARLHSRVFAEGEQVGFLTGKVTHIGATTGRPELRRLDPFAPAEQPAVEVRIELDPQASQVAARWLFLEVEVEFLTNGSAR